MNTTELEDGAGKPLEIGEGIYRLGARGKNAAMDCNTYLLVDEDEGVLVDPGPVTAFDATRERLASILDPAKISLLIAHHDGPDACAALPLFREARFDAPVACHWRTSVQLGFYGHAGEPYVVNEQGWEWSFRSGRTLSFLPAPYCHFAGSIMTWDERTKTLFSGDIFGAMTVGTELYADEDPSYVEAMKSFHEHFMPSREILKAVTNSIRPLDVALVAPQHGRLIRRDIRQTLDILRALPCGSFMGTTSAEPQDFSESTIGQVMQILNRVIGRLAGIFSPDEVRDALRNSPFTLREDTLLLEEIRIAGDYRDYVSLFIEHLVVTRGMRWFTLIEPYLFALLDEYHIPLPRFIIENPAFRFANAEEEKGNDAVLYDQKTGLYNGAVFRQFLATLLERRDGEPFGLAYFSIDNLEEINQLYGRKVGDDALKAMVYVLKNNISSYPAWNLFKLDAPYIACIADKAVPEVIRAMAEKVRQDANDAEFAAAKLVISAGIMYGGQVLSPTEWRDMESVERKLLARLFTARKETSGGICDFARDESEDSLFRRKILLVEPDETYIDFLRPYFESRGYLLQTDADGSGTFGEGDDELPDLVIAEAMTPRMNGFDLHDKLMASAKGRTIPFILVSRRKDEEFIKRAAEKGILFFLKKPFSKTELMGIVDTLMRQSR